MSIPIPDCDIRRAPFGTPQNPGADNPAYCQTGDSDFAPIQLQLFENDGVDDSVSFTTPLTACHLYVAPGTGGATYKNKWATICTFTPTAVGVYPLRVKSSAITLPNGTVVPDVGGGSNRFALRATGGSDTTVHALDRASVHVNGVQGPSRMYLTELTTEDAGSTVQLDVFGAGDSLFGASSLQIFGPPAGAPSVVPITGTVVPAPDLADSCRYNPVVSATRGPEVSGAGGADAPNCKVALPSGFFGGGYNRGWLSVELTISPTYSCTTDCWWTMVVDTTGTTHLESFVWSPIVIPPPDA